MGLRANGHGLRVLAHVRIHSMDLRHDRGRSFQARNRGRIERSQMDLISFVSGALAGALLLFVIAIVTVSND